MIWNKLCLVVFSYTSLFLMLASGCVNNDLKELEDKENAIIQQYLSDSAISADTKTEGGIYFIEEVPGTGLSPVKDNYVVINYVGRYLETLEIRETSDSLLADEWPASETFVNFLFGPAKLKYGYSIGGINEALSLMKEGGRASAVIPSDKAFYDHNPLLYELELIKVIRNPITYEDSVKKAYLDEKGFPESANLEHLIWFREDYTPDIADVKTVQKNDSVSFNFTGRLVDGFTAVLQDDRIFDSNQGDAKPVKILFDRSKINSRFPKGFMIALDSMRLNTRATAVIPYTQAYGEKGVVDGIYGYTVVPTYQTVVYSIEVVRIHTP
jgi:FKBP-type peptidyl-prolyl cis-trans isomerase